MFEPFIDMVMRKLLKDCDYLLTQEQQNYIRLAMANYAFGALMDRDIAKEVEDICDEP